MAEIAKEIINEFCRMCAHLKYSPNSTYPYECKTGCTCFRTLTRKCGVFKDKEHQAQRERDNRGGQELARETPRQQEKNNQSQRKLDEENYRRQEKLEAKKLEALQEMEKERLQHEEQLQEQHDQNADRREISKFLLGVALASGDDSDKTKQSLKTLLGDDLFKNNIDYVVEVIAGKPLLNSIYSEILEEKAMVDAEEIVNLANNESELISNIFKSYVEDEKVAFAIISNKMGGNKFGIEFDNAFKELADYYANQTKEFCTLLEAILPSSRLIVDLHAFLEGHLFHFENDDILAFKKFYSAVVELQKLPKDIVEEISEGLDNAVAFVQKGTIGIKDVLATELSADFFSECAKQDSFANIQAQYINVSKKPWNGRESTFLVIWVIIMLLAYFTMNFFWAGLINYFLGLSIPLTFLFGAGFIGPYKDKKLKNAFRKKLEDIISLEEGQILQKFGKRIDEKVSSLIPSDYTTSRKKLRSLNRPDSSIISSTIYEGVEGIFEKADTAIEKAIATVKVKACDIAKKSAREKIILSSILLYSKVCETCLQFEELEIIYTSSITLEKAHKLADFLLNNSFFLQNSKKCRVNKYVTPMSHNSYYFQYLVQVVIKKEDIEKYQWNSLCNDLRHLVFSPYFGGEPRHPVDIHFCDENLNILGEIKGDTHNITFYRTGGIRVN